MWEGTAGDIRGAAAFFFGVLTLSGCGASDPNRTSSSLIEDEWGLLGCPPVTAIETCHAQRAVLGISMGAAGAGQLGFARPELFDVIGMLGVPLVDWTYMMRVLERSYLGGFCSRQTILDHLDRVADPEGPAFCGPVRGTVRLTPRSEDWEHTLFEPDQDFNHWYRWIDEGRGGSFGRNSLRETFQDLALAYGNPISFSPDSPYYAPGLPLDYHGRTDTEKCGSPLRIEGVHHHMYNPDGRFPVLAFCDTRAQDGNFDVDRPSEVPFEILLAVDYNENGIRDYAEPVLFMAHERYQDDGVDSTGPYDWEDNPLGTRGNGRHEEGEPFDDFGLDGVPDTGDYGEGNGTFDVSPNVEQILRVDPRTQMENLPEGQLERLHIYADAGIRDFLGSAAAMNGFWGALKARVGADQARDYTTFARLGVGEGQFGFLDVDFSPREIGRHVYVRYGNPDAPQAEIEKGDGHHLGTIPQLLNRLFVALAFTESRFIDRDRTLYGDPSNIDELIEVRTFHSSSLDEDRDYGIVVPPGYDRPENQNRRYPVVYLLHGQGMDPTQFLASALLFLGQMADAVDEDNLRRSQSDWGKFILVFPDSTCSNGACRTGNFNTNHSGLDGHGPRYADSIFELMAHVEARYRVAPPRIVPRP